MTNLIVSSCLVVVYFEADVTRSYHNLLRLQYNLPYAYENSNKCTLYTHTNTYKHTNTCLFFLTTNCNHTQNVLDKSYSRIIACKSHERCKLDWAIIHDEFDLKSVG